MSTDLLQLVRFWLFELPVLQVHLNGLSKHEHHPEYVQNHQAKRQETITSKTIS